MGIWKNMDDSSDRYLLQWMLEDTVREAGTQLSAQPLYIVATEHGYDIVDKFPENAPVYYRVNMDGTTTLIVTDIETQKSVELHAHPASEPSPTMTDLAFEEENYGQ